MRLATLLLILAALSFFLRRRAPALPKPLPNVWTDDVDWEAWPA